jgi:hypothetical protein
MYTSRSVARNFRRGVPTSEKTFRPCGSFFSPVLPSSHFFSKGCARAPFAHPLATPLYTRWSTSKEIRNIWLFHCFLRYAFFVDKFKIILKDLKIEGVGWTCECKGVLLPSPAYPLIHSHTLILKSLKIILNFSTKKA